MSENWATYDDLTISKKLSPDEFLLTPANHDSTPIKNLALTDDLHKLTPTNELKNKKEKQVWALSNSFKRFFKDVEQPIEFMRLKFADSLQAKHHAIFITDVFGCREKLNIKTQLFPYAFRFKVPENYKEAYHKAVQSGFGFNLMDSLEKVFRKKGLNKTEPELYDKIVHFANVLYEPD